MTSYYIAVYTHAVNKEKIQNIETKHIMLFKMYMLLKIQSRKI